MQGFAPTNSPPPSKLCSNCTGLQFVESGCCVQHCEGCRGILHYHVKFCATCSQAQGKCQNCGNSLSAAPSVPPEPAICLQQAPHCPHCGGNDRIIPIIWGGPAPGDSERVARDEIELGGCVLPSEGPIPRWRCRSCGQRFE